MSSTSPARIPAEARSASWGEAPSASVTAHFRISLARVGDTRTAHSTSDVADFGSCRACRPGVREFLAVLTIIFLQHHLRLQLRRNQTERLGALRAADVINYTAGECLAMAGRICPLPRRSAQDRLAGVMRLRGGRADGLQEQGASQVSSM